MQNVVYVANKMFDFHISDLDFYSLSFFVLATT